MKKLKIGVTCYPSVGGSGVVATELAKMMANRGHEIHFITSGRPFRLPEEHPNIHFHGVRIEGYSVFQYPPYDIALANKMALVIEQEKLDLLHIHYAVPHAISAALAKDMIGSNIGVITTLHGTDVTVLGRDPALKNTVKYGIEKSTVTTAVSESLRDETIELIHPTADIRVIYNFIDESKYKVIPENCMKQELGIEQDERVFIHISNFRPVKRIVDILAAFKIVASKSKSKLLLVGEGPEKAKIEKLVQEWGIKDNALFTGKRHDLPEILSICDAMFLLSEKESFGLVLLEAFACGVPCIGTNIGGIPEVIEDGTNGYLIELGDVEAAAERALQIISDKDVHSKLRDGALHTASTKFHSTAIVDQYEKLYDEVADWK